MKTAYIIYKNNKPKDKKEVLDCIIHFCREHLLTFQILQGSDISAITIEGEEYTVSLEENYDEAGSIYWIIYCLLKCRISLFNVT